MAFGFDLPMLQFPEDEQQPLVPGFAPPRARPGALPVAGAQAVPGLDIDPAIVAQMLGMGGNEQEQALQRQLAQAQALRAPSGQRHTTGWGAALGGLGDVINAVRGGFMEKEAREGLAGLGKQRMDAKTAYAKALLGSPESAERYAQLGILSGDPAAAALGGKILEEGTASRKFGLTQTMESIRNLREKKEQAERTRANQEYQDKARAENIAAQIRAAEIAANRKTEEGEKPQRIPASSAQALGAMQGVSKLIPKLGEEFDRYSAEGIQAFFKGQVPRTEQDRFNKVRKVYVQQIGSALEKGKLTNDDEKKYDLMMPALGDSRETKDAKLRVLSETAKIAYDAELEGLRRGRYDVTGFEPSGGDQKPKLEGFSDADEARLKELESRLGGNR